MAIIDVLWNGIAESVKMAELCDLYEVGILVIVVYSFWSCRPDAKSLFS